MNVGVGTAFMGAVSGSISDVTQTQRQTMHTPTTVVADRFMLRAGNAHLTDTQIKARLVDAIIRGDMVIESLADWFFSEAKGGSFGIGLGFLSLVNGVQAMTDAARVTAGIGGGIVDVEEIERKVNAFASIVGEEQFNLVVGGTLLARSAFYGHQRDAELENIRPRTSLESTNPHEHIKVGKAIHETVQEEHTRRDESYSIPIGDLFTVISALTPREQLAKAVFEKEKAAGKTDAEALQTSTESKQIAEVAESADRKVAIKQKQAAVKIRQAIAEKYLKGTYGHTLMDTRADKMAISIRATLINAISIFDVLRESDTNNFSIKDWILSPAGDEQLPKAARFLFLSCTPAQRTTLIPIITAWLSIATEYLLHTKPTSNRTWLFIDELHNLKRLPKIETSLAEIRKYGGCFVIGTQMVSQLNKIYGHEIAKTITGLCGTKIVMGIPEPETAKYMSGFLGEKEEVSNTEGISYGANTIRDGVNIAQKTEKKLTVPYTEIMDLKPGEAFIRFSGVDMVTKAQFKLHEITENKRENTKIISLQKYISKNPPSGTDLLLYGIPLSESVLSKPIYVFDNELSDISELLAQVRRLNKKNVVFENGSNIYDACFKDETDILINLNKENGHSWNILKDFDDDYGLLTQMLTKKFEERDSKDVQRYLMTVFMNMDNIFSEINVKNVLSTIMFAPMKNASKTLSRIFDLDSQKYSDIRTDLMIHNNHLSLLLNDNENIAIRDYISDKSYDGKIMFVSCFNDLKMKEIMKLITNYCSIQDTITIHDTNHAKNRKAIIVCDGKSQIPENNGSVIVKYEVARANKVFDSILRNSLRNESETPQFLAKIYGVNEIVEI